MLPVLYIITSLETGGAERTLAGIVEGLDRAKYRPLVCCLLREGVLAETVRCSGAEIIGTRMKHRGDLGVVPRLTRFIRRERIPVVHSFLAYGNCLGIPAARLAKVPAAISTLTSMAGSGALVGKKGAFIRAWADKFTCRCSDRVVVPSEAMKRHLLEAGIKEDKIEVIYGGVDPEKFDSVPEGAGKAEFGFSATSPVAGMIARLEERKDHETFLRSAVRVLEELPEVNFLVVGGGPLEDKLKRYAVKLKLDKNVVFAGERYDIEAINRSIDVAVLSSRTESLGFSLLEAMAAGRPVVASNVGGVSEVVENLRTGILVPPGDERALAAAIVKVLKDKELARNMGTAGRKRIKERFLKKKMVEKVEALYDRSITRSGGEGVMIS